MTVSLPSPIRGWRAILVVAAVVYLTPGRAVAECGDYVTILNGSGNTAHHPAPQAGDPPAAPKPPCDGPNCSGAPARQFPPVTPASPVGGQAKELTQHLGAAITSEPSPGSGFARDPASGRPIHRANSVFHPPRLG